MFTPINKVVISYSRRDSLKIKQLVEELRLNGIDPFLDIEDIPAGVDWEFCLEQAIDQAYAFIFAISSSSIKSPVCLWELETAIKAEIPILPVVFEEPEDEPHELLLSLRRKNWIYLNNGSIYQVEFQKLIEALFQIDNYLEDLDRSPKAKLTTFCRTPSLQMRTDYFLLTAKVYCFGRNPPPSLQNNILEFRGDPTVSKNHGAFLWSRQSKSYEIRDGDLNGVKLSSFGIYVSCDLEKGKAIGGRRLQESETYLLKNLEFVRFGKFSFFCYEIVQGNTLTFDAKSTIGADD